MLTPLPEQRWNFEAAAHLLNRAGFGGTPAQIKQLASLGLEKAAGRLVDYDLVVDSEPDPDWAKPDLDRAERLEVFRRATEEERRKLRQEEQREQRQRITDLRHWWLRRMATTSRPLQEKLTLFWHGHFATSIEKVRDAYLMWRQNELFRRLAIGNWKRLLTEAAQDPAMLLYLDQAQSRKEHPNENFARELMELFSLGEGHYTEKDVTEAARALTGWSLDRATQRFIVRPAWHDPGQKTLFGKTGAYDGSDVMDRIVELPQSARFITAKLWTFFAGQAPSSDVAQQLEETFRRSDFELKPVMRAIFRSEAFYAPGIVRNMVKSPVQWLVGSVRMLETTMPSAAVAAGLTRNLGQDLFAPPNVKGWEGGLSWITTNNLLGRYNQASILIEGDPRMFAAKNGRVATTMRNQTANQRGVNATTLFTGEELANKPALVSALERRFLQGELKPRQKQVLTDFLNELGPIEESDLRKAIRLVMSTPEYQLT